MNCINNESERNKREYPPLGKHNIGGDFLRRPPYNFKNRYPHEQRILVNGARNYSINRGIINNSELEHKQMPGQYQSSSSDSTFSAGRHIYRERQHFHTPFSNTTLKFANQYSGTLNNVRINGHPKYNVSNQSLENKHVNFIKLTNKRFLHPFINLIMSSAQKKLIESSDAIVHFGNFGFSTKIKSFVLVQNILPFVSKDFLA